MKKKKSERNAIIDTNMFRLIQALHSYLNLKQFSIQQSCSGVGASQCVFDEDIFERLTSLSLMCHLSHTRGISLFSDDDDVLAELSKSADEADKRWRQSRVCAHQLNLALVCHYGNNAAIITSMNRQTISWICRADLVGRKNSLWALHTTAGRSLVEHLCKHKTSLLSSQWITAECKL